MRGRAGAVRSCGAQHAQERFADPGRRALVVGEQLVAGAGADRR
jgi:hypothetical protein